MLDRLDDLSLRGDSVDSPGPYLSQSHSPAPLPLRSIPPVAENTPSSTTASEGRSDATPFSSGSLQMVAAKRK